MVRERRGDAMNAPKPTGSCASGRDPHGVIVAQHARLSGAPVIAELLEAFPEAALILNEQRQIVLGNERFRRMVARSGEQLLGLRPGEALGCVHAFEGPNGCGSSAACRFCGALAASEGCRANGTETALDCRIRIETDRGEGSLDLEVRCRPLEIDVASSGGVFQVVALRDQTSENRRAVLERIFFHDLLNAAGGLQGILEIWPQVTGGEAQELIERARALADQVIGEIEAQRDLAAAERGELGIFPSEFDAASLLVRLSLVYDRHEVAHAKKIGPPRISGETRIRTDEVLLTRVLGNLIKNALEASAPGERVDVEFTSDPAPTFRVCNPAVMPEEVRQQVFQRSFSTKAGRGRGIGTYSAKLLTERYLDGTIACCSDEGRGTVFTVSLPKAA
ncbi:MAG: histidine kinase [Candidatus Eisenbacteria bacterium]|nr:histidine kinase [Candidatus Latescibacterota bacterium]MBD3302801.1 histidine kinase [Candidatus Eisenbacteria bacterium]